MICVMAVAAAHCAKKKSVRYESPEELARFVIERMHKGDSKAVIRSLVTKNEFIRDIYPYTEEAGSPGALPGDDFWRIHMEWRRINAIIQKTKDYRGKIVSFDGVGEPGRSITAGPYRFLQGIPLHLTVLDDYGAARKITDDRFLGVVVQSGNAYMLLNVRK